jgi:hypothetical protein
MLRTKLLWQCTQKLRQFVESANRNQSYLLEVLLLLLLTILVFLGIGWM